MTADAPDGGMEMNYTITMPVTAFDGSELSGELSWLMLVDGTEGASGSQPAEPLSAAHTPLKAKALTALPYMPAMKLAAARPHALQ